MKLHRIIAILLCLTALACAGALADGKPELSFDNDSRLLIIDKNNMVDFGAFIDGEVDEDNVVTLSVDGIEKEFEIELAEDGRLMPIELPELEVEIEYSMTLAISGYDGAEVEDDFMIKEFVGMRIDNAEFFPMNDNTYQVVVNVNGRESLKFEFDKNIDIEESEISFEIIEKGVSKPIKEGSMDDFDGVITTKVDFEERKIVFSYENYEVTYVICLYKNEEEFDAKIAAMTDPDDDTEAGSTAENMIESTAEPTAEPTVEPTEAITEAPAEDPIAKPTEAPTQEPTAEPTAEPSPEPEDDTSDDDPEGSDKVSSNIKITGIFPCDVDEFLKFDVSKVDDRTYEATVYGSQRFRIIGTCSSGEKIVAKKKDTAEQLGNDIENENNISTWGIDLDMRLSDDITLVIYIEGNEAESIELTLWKDTICKDVKPEPVTEGDETITGTTEAGAEVYLRIDDVIQAETVADNDGKFEFSVDQISRNRVYELQAKDKAGNESGWIKVDVAEYDGSHDQIELKLSYVYPETAEETAYVGAETAELKLKIESKIDANVQLYICDAEKDGQEKALGEAVEVESGNAMMNLPDSAKNTIPINTADIGSDGTYRIFVRYCDLYESYESESLTLIVDRTVPETPVIVTNELYNDGSSIAFTVGEDCTVEVMVDGEIDGEKNFTAGENSYVFAGELEKDMKISITAIDEAGNRSESSSLTVLARDKAGWIGEGVSWNTTNPFEPMTVTGSFNTIAEKVDVEIIFECNGREYGDIDVKINAEPSDDENFTSRITYTASDIDTGSLPVGENINVKVNVTAEDEEILRMERIFKLQKDNSALAIRMLLLVVILAGFVTALTAFVKVNGRIAGLKKAALDSENESNLTIRRRGISRAGK